ncbi:hypothetical protein CORMATOL_00117 [Corynebacterium matruchotii ATCC 33806]|uniref:Uncharacterized protein n=1 Tax=Corynebacterium matruchotii ATCC 33806 TaxID=566549 RepID=C0DZH8_9CORY|nr:hypothetical protein CORMATOL_00117 [Corynebacterium matruchotii ATCC 33806]
MIVGRVGSWGFDVVIFENHAYLVCYLKMPYTAHLISMVSVPMAYRLRHCRWETMLRTCPRGWSAHILSCRTCSKHGLSLASILTPGDLMGQISNTMLIR